jgi:tetratricopeptide (TPR) repeat protein
MSSSVFAQLADTLNPEIRAETIEKLSVMLNDYVYPEKGREVAGQLLENLKNGNYDGIEDFREFGRRVTEDLYQLSEDKHLLIRYDPEDVADIKRDNALPESEKGNEEMRKKAISAKDNFGFKEMKIFPANIGYLKLNEFEKAEYAAETAHAAMAFVANVEALIIDLRDNNGGWSNLVQIMCSYFFELRETEKNSILFEIHNSYKNEIVSYRLLQNLPGKRLTEIPVYILTSELTYSAAEKFTDVLQKRKRAIVVGKRTKGGANSTRGPEVLNDYYIVKMPVGRTVNPVTNSNWEGTGIEPDIQTESKNALNAALQLIIEDVIEQNPAENFINRLGYSFLYEDKVELAIRILKQNVKRYPESANVYDSLGEAYMLNNENELAIKNYRKSLEINPANDNAVRMIKKIQGE